jgi:hypothetical protein
MRLLRKASARTFFCCGPFEAHTVGFSGQEDADPDIPILKQAKAEYSKLERENRKGKLEKRDSKLEKRNSQTFARVCTIAVVQLVGKIEK